MKKIIAFFHFIEGLKKVERYKDNVFWRDYDWIDRWESVADHTWRIAIMLIVLEDKLQKPIDLQHALKIVLVHDLPEIIAGDPSPLGSDGTGRDSHRFNEEKKREKFSREEKAAREIFNMLPEKDARELYDLWHEYESQETYESQVVKALDKLEAKFQVIEYTNCHVYEEQIEPIIGIGKDEMLKEPVVYEMYNELMSYFKEHYKAFKKVPDFIPISK